MKKLHYLKFARPIYYQYEYLNYFTLRRNNLIYTFIVGLRHILSL